ncbi:MAG: DUF4174 domain-containing protein [Salibaculum sp.]|jgi:hypothetical protein|uniref:DUF4174 domain-containing protein n=1 Tax=Salibaculum sp. TaxID=2855480 RepID=UPI00286FC281|nr:DUF4174 domain-containing protein [Salibaculum sp.]MDR9427059.1 DUF4174 domain-containing protein [Salibaculum sp.]MDR9481942.1 DUF4174 domain-containing protein [Salibaculum sp.]
MFRLIALVIAGLMAGAAAAQDDSDRSAVEIWQDDPSTVFSATEVEVKDFIWIARPIVLFADNPNDPNFRQQLDFLNDRSESLAERDVVVITDTDTEPMTELRKRLRPRGFMLVIMGKDGEIELRKPTPWGGREITRTIDKMPLRQQEIDAARGF